MTVIAWDGKTVAADKMSLRAGGLKMPVTKLHRLSCGGVAAYTGDLNCGLLLLEWAKNGFKKEEFPEKAKEDVSTLIVFKPKAAYIYSTNHIPITTDCPFDAFGSGRDFALAMLHIGRSVEDAVIVANQFCEGCGMGVDTMTPI